MLNFPKISTALWITLKNISSDWIKSLSNIFKVFIILRFDGNAFLCLAQHYNTRRLIIVAVNIRYRILYFFSLSLFYVYTPRTILVRFREPTIYNDAIFEIRLLIHKRIIFDNYYTIDCMLYSWIQSFS